MNAATDNSSDSPTAVAKLIPAPQSGSNFRNAKDQKAGSIGSMRAESASPSKTFTQS